MPFSIICDLRVTRDEHRLSLAVTLSSHHSLEATRAEARAEEQVGHKRIIGDASRDDGGSTVPDGLCPVHSPVPGREVGKQWNLRMNLVVTRFLATNCPFSTLYLVDAACRGCCWIFIAMICLSSNTLYTNYTGPDHSN